MLKAPKRIIICEKDSARRAFIQTHYPDMLVCEPEDCKAFVRTHSDHGGADVVLEVAGAKNTFELAWRLLPPQRHRDGRRLLRRAANASPAGNVWENLIFKTGGVDGCDCAEILRLIAQGKIDTTPLIASR